jgi:hypothetical protein
MSPGRSTFFLFEQRPCHRHPTCLRHVAGEHSEGMVGMVVRACGREGMGAYPGGAYPGGAYPGNPSSSV